MGTVSFNVYASFNLVDWSIATNVVTTNAILPFTQQSRFFFVSASNEFGEIAGNLKLK